MATVTHEKAHQVLLAMFPPDALVLCNFHRHLPKHGQRICACRYLICEQCALKDLCH